MPRTGLSKDDITKVAVKLANENGLSYLSITTLAEALGIKKPSLYNHMNSIDDVLRDIMIYGWKKVSYELTADITGKDPRESLRIYATRIYEYSIANPGVFEAMLWYNKYLDPELLDATEGLYNFFFAQTDSLFITREIANHLLRTYRAFLEGFIMLEIHNAFGNPISIQDSFRISLDVLLKGMHQYSVEQVEKEK